MTILAILVLLAFALAIASLAGYCPVTVPVLLLSIVELLRIWPLK